MGLESTSASELVLRALVVYGFLFISLRCIGKKHIGEFAPFDLVMLLILSESVQNAMVGDEKSLAGGLISAATLLCTMQLMNWLSWRSKPLFRIIEGVPQILVRHGHCYRSVMEREKISIQELTEAMRRHGCSNIAGIRLAVLENDGTISIIRERKEGQTGE